MRFFVFALTSFLAVHGAVAGTITRAGSLAVGRYGAGATLLGDGRVLVTGGDPAERRIELFDPGRGVSTLLPATTRLPLLGHTATRLDDGRVLLLGGGYATDGRPAFGRYGSNDSIAYDAPSASLLDAGTLIQWRMDHAATLLEGGRVLITGGENVDVGGFHFWRSVYDSAEIFDPKTNAFHPAAPMHEPRSSHTATRLRDGRVLIAGGLNGSQKLTSLEIFDPRSETFTQAGSLHTGHGQHTATLLPDGRVLIAGGTDGDYASAEIFDPATSGVAIAGNIGQRRRHAATLLPTGRVLIADGGVANAIVFDPATSAIVEVLPLPEALVARTAVLLEDGSVLLIGGFQDFVARTDVLRYRPASPGGRQRAVRR